MQDVLVRLVCIAFVTLDTCNNAALESVAMRWI